MSNELKDYIMNKKLSNRLSTVACLLADDKIVECDIIVSSVDVRLVNWPCDMVPTSDLRRIFVVCDRFDLLPFVDFQNKLIVIHG